MYAISSMHKHHFVITTAYVLKKCQPAERFTHFIEKYRFTTATAYFAI